MGGLSFNEFFQHRQHVTVVGVHLVDDEHLAPEAKEPQPRIIGTQAGKQRLVDRADAGWSEQRALLPGLNASAFGRALEFAFLLGAAVSQDPVDRRNPDVVEKLFAPLEGLVGCCHRWQADIDAGCPASGDQAVGDVVRGLGLASAGHVLDDDENWTIAGLPCIEQPLARDL